MPTLQAITLVITLFYSDKPPKEFQLEMPDKETCFQEEAEFWSHDFSDDKNLIARAAGCLVPQPKSEKS